MVVSNHDFSFTQVLGQIKCADNDIRKPKSVKRGDTTSIRNLYVKPIFCNNKSPATPKLVKYVNSYYIENFVCFVDKILWLFLGANFVKKIFLP
jgi:hypothetical protein